MICRILDDDMQELGEVGKNNFQHSKEVGRGVVHQLFFSGVTFLSSGDICEKCCLLNNASYAIVTLL